MKEKLYTSLKDLRGKFHEAKKNCSNLYCVLGRANLDRFLSQVEIDNRLPCGEIMIGGGKPRMSMARAEKRAIERLATIPSIGCKDELKNLGFNPKTSLAGHYYSKNNNRGIILAFYGDKAVLRIFTQLANDVGYLITNHRKDFSFNLKVAVDTSLYFCWTRFMFEIAWSKPNDSILRANIKTWDDEKFGPTNEWFSSVLLPDVFAASALAIDYLLNRELQNTGDLINGELPKTNKTRKKRKRRKASDKIKPLTEKQTEAMQIVGECKGNIAKAARQIGIDRKSMEERYVAAAKKIGHTPIKHTTHKLPTDRRDQESISKEDDHRLQ